MSPHPERAAAVAEGDLPFSAEGRKPSEDTTDANGGKPRRRCSHDRKENVPSHIITSIYYRLARETAG